MISRSLSATNSTDNVEQRWQTEDELIFSFNLGLLVVYSTVLFFVFRKIGLSKLRYPLNMYLMVYTTVFIWRFIDGTLIMFAIDRDALGKNANGYLYFATINISSIVDRFSIFIMIHFVFEMWAVKSTLGSQSYAEKQ